MIPVILALVLLVACTVPVENPPVSLSVLIIDPPPHSEPGEPWVQP